MKTYELQGHPYIELNKMLKLLRWASSGGEANQLIKEGLVKVNGETEYRKRKKLTPGDIVFYEGQMVTIVKDQTL
jgi:ribosome-associated protein